jgi:hypothetical protein
MEAHGELTKRFEGDVLWSDITARGHWTNLQRQHYIDSSGATVAGGVDVTGSAGGEAKIGAKITKISGPIEEVRPWNAASADWIFRNDGSFVANAGTIYNSADARFDVGMGLDVEFVGGTTVSASGSYFATNTRLEGWRVESSLAVPLSVLMPGVGFAEGGMLNFDVGQRANEETSLTARLKIDLD